MTITRNHGAGVDKHGVNETYVAKNGTRVEFKNDAIEDERVLIEVDVAPDTTMVGRQLVRSGKHSVLVYRSDLPEIREMVQTDEDKALWAAAERAHTLRLAATICEALGIKPRRPEDAEALWRAAVAENADKARMAESVMYRYGSHAANEFINANPLRKHGVPPLRSMRVLEDDIAKPDTPTSRVERQESTNAALLERLAAATEALARVHAGNGGNQKNR